MVHKRIRVIRLIWKISISILRLIGKIMARTQYDKSFTCTLLLLPVKTVQTKKNKETFIINRIDSNNYYSKTVKYLESDWLKQRACF